LGYKYLLIAELWF